MIIEKIGSNAVIAISKQASLQEAARLMKQSNIGAVVVVDNKDQYPIPCGILTDRDIIMHLLSEDINLDKIKVEDIMSRDLFLVDRKQEIRTVIQQMSAKRIRRAPIVDDDGRLIGMVSTDDLVIFLVDQLNDIATLIREQIKS